MRLENNQTHRSVIWIAVSIWCLAGTAFAGVSSELPHVTKEMTEAEFWLKRLPEPDKPLLSPDAIEHLNRRNLSLEPSAIDVTTLAEVLPGDELRRRLQEEIKPFRNRSFYTWDASGGNVLFGTIEFELLKERMRMKDIPEKIGVRFGLIVQECDVRSFPLKEGIFAKKEDEDFDLAQQTRLAVGTPVAVLWEGEGGGWLYTVNALLGGWVKKDSVGFFENQAAMASYLGKPFLMVTVPSITFDRTQKPDGIGTATLTMGTVLHGYTKHGSVYSVDYPVRAENGRLAFESLAISEPESKGLHEGFLPFTRANILRQALALEGAPYGWGGLNGGYDCSSFLQNLFVTMGIQLPRNSGPQSKVGEILAEFSPGTEGRVKQDALFLAPPLTTFVHLDGHIMLYLGAYRKRPYVIHATSGYQSKRFFRKKKYRLMSVVISDLSLGK